MDLPSSERKRQRTAAELADDAALKNPKDLIREWADDAPRMIQENVIRWRTNTYVEYLNKLYAHENVMRSCTHKYVEYLNKLHGHDQVVEVKENSSIPSRSARWSELPTELLELILIKVLGPFNCNILGFRDILYFKGVCDSWRAAAKSCSSYVQLPRIPCLLLPNQKNWSLFDPNSNKVYTMRNVDFDLFPNGTIVGTSYGWIVMFDRDGWNKSKARIINPITGASIPIPGTKTLPQGRKKVLQAIISSDPSCNNNFVVVVKYDIGRLAYYRHGDQDMSWKKLDDGCRGDMPFRDKSYPIVFHDDHLVASAWHLTKVWNFKESPPLQRRFIKETPDKRTFNRYYLVESLTGEILRLGRDRGEDGVLEGNQFCVENLNLAEGKWENLQHLGDQSLFMFRKQLVSLPNPCFLGCEKNSICFGVKKLTTWKEYLTYNLEEAKIGILKRKFTKGGINGCRRPLWIVSNPW